ncbi:MAG: hypothetical protein QM820_05250 [Minicystis sp.]
MRLHSLKLGSLLALTACLGAASSGCFFVHDDGDDGCVPPDDSVPVQTQPQLVAIDADATLQVTPGDGVGVFVEYTTGGHWNVFTTCDFNTPANPGVSCGYDIFATVLDRDATIDNPKGQELSGKDGIELAADGTVHLYTENTVGLNGMTFDTPPGATVEIEAYLDGVADPHYIYWVGKDVLHRGAPSNPLDLQPSEAPAAPTDGTSTGGTSTGGTSK